MKQNRGRIPRLKRQTRWLKIAILGFIGLAILAGLFVTSVYTLMINRPLTFRHCDHHRGENTPGSNCSFDTKDEAPLEAVAYICTGSGCNLELLCTSVLALRVAAGWSGKVYVITDRSADVTGLCAVELDTVPVPPVEYQMQMKNMKRQMFDILPGRPSSVLYVDADIVPVGCLQRFLRNIATQGIPELAFFHDNVCLGCNTFNGGFVYQRDTPATRKCLEAWTAESSSANFTRYVKDQDALDAVLSQGGCGFIQALPASAVVFVDSALWPAFLRMTFSRPLFQHFTTGVRHSDAWSRIYSSLQAQLHELHLRLKTQIATC
ncbi:hypothetical protein CYMTET_4668 [Cymbomonas tetramitiformis]|uniref:Uncharacterized protein n=1 Tax=Cymbomonas tetramitiformis TaxID=36881 RepID=A0AAE0LK55_9CHLO|nr:hypothetical protein CYMTET_4668 [Cymbomonas tetramitiformis]